VSFTRDVRQGDPVTESLLRTDVHCGTHVDAPLHFLPDGRGVDGLPVEAFLGPVLVVDACGHLEVPEEVVDEIPNGTRRILFRTDNSTRSLMRTPTFDPEFVGLSVQAARALAQRDEILLVGNDYLSVQPWQGDDDVHRVLLRRGVALLEGVDLTGVEPGWYELFALPLLLHGAEGAPVRAVLSTQIRSGFPEQHADVLNIP
jgi:arylformamidase